MAFQRQKKSLLPRPETKAQLYIWFAIGSLASSGYFFIFYSFFAAGSFLFWFNVGVILSYTLIILALKWTKRKQKVFLLAIFLGYFSFLTHILLTGGISSSAVPHLIVAALFSFFFSNQKRIFGFFGTSILILVLMGIGELLFYDALHLIPENDRVVFNFWNQLYSGIVIFFFVYIFTAQAKDYSRSLKSSLIELGKTTNKLVESEKFASLGELTAGLAHEINNPVNYVQGNAGLIQKLVADLLLVESLRETQDQELRTLLAQEDPSRYREVIQQIVDATHLKKQEIEYPMIREELDQLLDGLGHGVRRISEIVRSLRIYSSTGNTTKNAFDIHESLESALILLNHLIVGKIEIKQYRGNVDAVIGNPGRISQVIINIVSNAIQSIPMGEQGIITIKTFQNNPRFVQLSIADNGPGIPELIRKKVFDPFFTTKDVGDGTGLGLSISKGIVEEHDGEIVLETEEGAGTTFIISLPVDDTE